MCNASVEKYISRVQFSYSLTSAKFFYSKNMPNSCSVSGLFTFFGQCLFLVTFDALWSFMLNLHFCV